MYKRWEKQQHGAISISRTCPGTIRPPFDPPLPSHHAHDDEQQDDDEDSNDEQDEQDEEDK